LLAKVHADDQLFMKFIAERMLATQGDLLLFF